jgi:GNAT acetyltransferase
MATGGDAARRAWAHLIGLPALAGVQVLVDRDSPLGRRGWIAILALDGSVTACVPRPDLVRPVAAGLADLTPREATSPDIVRARLPVSRAVLGPAALFYPPAGFKAHWRSGVEEACRGDVEDLITSASPDELDESGVHEITGPLFISRASTGDVAAACGYRCWPNHVAHLSVLTHSTHRREGHARRAAETAISHAIAEHLLPQWRARPEGSRALARRLGLVELGAQLSLEPA